MANTVSQEPTSFAGCALKGFVIFVIFTICLVIVRALVIPLWEISSEKRENLSNAQLLGQMVAHINHERQLGSPKSLKDLFDEGVVHLGWDIGSAREIGWKGMECREVPRKNQVGELSKVEFYIIKKGSSVGMLSDGRFIYSPFDLEKASKNLFQYDYKLR